MAKTQIQIPIFATQQLMPNTHRRRRRDKTVSSRRRRRCVLGIGSHVLHTSVFAALKQMLANLNRDAIGTLYTSTPCLKKLCKIIFVRTLSNFNREKFWHKDSKDDKLMHCALIFHLT